MGSDIKEGKAYSWSGQAEYGKPLTDLARTGCDNGAGQVLLYDHSENDEDHEAVTSLIKETTRAVDEPILAGGRMKRPEDVKKYLHAGVSAVFLDVSRGDNVDMMKEAASRFGSEKVYTYLLDIIYIPQAEEYMQLGASVAILRAPAQVPSPQELGEIGESGHEVLTFCGGRQSAQDMAGELKIHFGCPLVGRAVLTLEEESMDIRMKMKQVLKGAGIETDTFESTMV